MCHDEELNGGAEKKVQIRRVQNRYDLRNHNNADCDGSDDGCVGLPHDLVAGFDNVLIELRNELVNGLPGDLSKRQRRTIRGHVDEQIAAAREGAEECG